MQNYISLAEKNGVILSDSGKCQFCGANTKRGVHECVEIFSVGFQEVDLSRPVNHIYRFFIVDAHTLQHPEIHGRWNNHFHLSRLHLIFTYGVNWTYDKSPKLSDCLNKYKASHPDEYLTPPPLLQRGQITSSVIKDQSENPETCKALMEKWAKEVYEKWHLHHQTVDQIAQLFLKK